MSSNINIGTATKYSKCKLTPESIRRIKSKHGIKHKNKRKKNQAENKPGSLRQSQLQCKKTTSPKFSIVRKQHYATKITCQILEQLIIEVYQFWERASSRVVSLSSISTVAPCQNIAPSSSIKTCLFPSSTLVVNHPYGWMDGFSYPNFNIATTIPFRKRSKA